MFGVRDSLCCIGGGPSWANIAGVDGPGNVVFYGRIVLYGRIVGLDLGRIVHVLLKVVVGCAT